MLPTIRHSLTDHVKKELYNYICGMDLQAGAKLPAEDEIARNFGVSRVTIRHVLGELESENIVFRLHGKGTFVNPEAVQIKVGLNPAQEFHHLIKMCGYQPRTEVIQIQQDAILPEIAVALALPADTALLWVEKVYYAGENPAILCFNYFDMCVFPEIPAQKDFQSTSAFFLLRERAGKMLLRDKIELKARDRAEVAPLSTQTEKFNCRAFLQLDTVNYDQDNAPTMFGRNFYNTNFIRFHLMRAQDVY